MSNEPCDSILVVLSNMELGEQQNESPPQNMLPPIVAPALAEPPQNQQMQDPHSTLYNWQATKVNVNDRIAYLFNNEVLSDVHFIVGRAPNQQRIPAHRFILSAGSAVFDAMFNGTLATGAKEEHLPDVEPSAFLSLLRFLYSDVVNICPDTVMTTLYTAKKYAVPSLEKHCVDFLKTNLGSYNAFLLLTQARLFDEPQLAALCFEMIDKNTVDALAADGFTDIDMETLICILQRDSLRVSEIKLFEATVRWAKAECLRRQRPPTPLAMREVLGGALKLLRFPLMNVEEFAAEPARSGLLTDAEVVAMFLYYHVNPKPSAGFPETPRCCMVGKEQTVKRFMRIESRWGYSGTSDCIRFSADVDVFVVGFGLYGSIHGPADYEVDLQIIQANTERIKAKHKTIFSCDGSDKAFRVMFKEPVEVLANVLYIASATLKGPDSHYGTKGMRKVVVDLPNEGVKTLHWNNMRETSVQSSGNNKVTFNFSYASGQNNGTSVEDGQIPEIIFYT